MLIKATAMATKHRGTAEETRALDAYIKLMRAANTVTQNVHRHLSRTALSVSQFGVLEALYHLGPMAQNVLGQKILKSGGNITLIVDNLEKQGLVERKQPEKDRRVRSVHLTVEGSRLMAELFPRHVAMIVEEMRPLSPSEQEELGRLCRRLGLGKKTIQGSIPGHNPLGQQ